MSGETTGRLVVGNAGIGHPASELVLPALMLRSRVLPFDELVHIYIPGGPTLAFSARDLRSPTFGRAVEIARTEGFAPVVRSPGGRMVAYDEGAVVVDHIDRTSGLNSGGSPTFAANAVAHAEVLASLGATDVRVGEIPGEYCPGEFSLSIGGAVKVVGSAQRIAGRGGLFSTIVQVAPSDAVRRVISRVSAALGYDFRSGTVGGLHDFLPNINAGLVADALADDYRRRLRLTDGQLPASLVAEAGSAVADAQGPKVFGVEDWVRERNRAEIPG